MAGDDDYLAMMKRSSIVGCDESCGPLGCRIGVMHHDDCMCSPNWKPRSKRKKRTEAELDALIEKIRRA